MSYFPCFLIWHGCTSLLLNWSAGHDIYIYICDVHKRTRLNLSHICMGRFPRWHCFTHLFYTTHSNRHAYTCKLIYTLTPIYRSIPIRAISLVNLSFSILVLLKFLPFTLHTQTYAQISTCIYVHTCTHLQK